MLSLQRMELMTGNATMFESLMLLANVIFGLTLVERRLQSIQQKVNQQRENQQRYQTQNN